MNIKNWIEEKRIARRKVQEENLALQEEGVRRKRERNEEWQKINQHMNKVRFFPGSKSEYESLVGYEVEIIIPSKGRNMGVTYSFGYFGERWDFDESDLQRLVNQNIEAIINCGHSCKETYPGPVGYYYGLPVAKKKNIQT